ncbi:MAG: cation diffusion facilitator family transporter [Firmicutes bacterium]|nr:cation diffusion facilitator family transporter [Bacillota bacterium]
MKEKAYLAEDSKRRKTIKKVAVVTLSANIVIMAAKMTVGAIFGNVSVISDALHSLSDIGTTVLVLAAVFISKPAADESHNYGHEKREPLITLFFALILGALSGWLIYEGITGIISPKPFRGVDTGFWMLIGVVTFSALSKEAMFWFTVTYAKKTKSDLLKADAWHQRSDSLSSLAVLAGLISSVFIGNDIVESIAIIIVALTLLWITAKILKTSVDKLTDKAADAPTRAGLLKIITETQGVITVDKLQTRIFGSGYLVDVEIGVNPDLTVTAAHDIAQAVHDALEAQPLYPVKHCNVHVNPVIIQSSDC